MNTVNRMDRQSDFERLDTHVVIAAFLQQFAQHVHAFCSSYFVLDLLELAQLFQTREHLQMSLKFIKLMYMMVFVQVHARVMYILHVAVTRACSPSHMTEQNENIFMYQLLCKLSHQMSNVQLSSENASKKLNRPHLQAQLVVFGVFPARAQQRCDVSLVEMLQLTAITEDMRSF